MDTVRSPAGGGRVASTQHEGSGRYHWIEIEYARGYKGDGGATLGLVPDIRSVL